MGQFGFFDLTDRYASLDAKKDPLVHSDSLISWEDFRTELVAVRRRSRQRPASFGGRRPWDAVLMFKALILCSLYNLSDDQVEYQLRDRLSFMRFLGLGLEDKVPDAKTVWMYREQLAQAGAVEGLFARFDACLKASGYLAMGGQIVDASIVPTPRQHNSKEENKQIRAGETPPEWEKKPAKLRQKDRDGRWTKKNNRSHYGYKNHIGIDRRYKLVRCWSVTLASTHDSQALDDILDESNTASGVWADSAYWSAEIEEKLTGCGLKSHVHRKAKRNHPLSEREKQGNRTRSSVRARVEHVFGAQSNEMGGPLIRCIGVTRARAVIGLRNIGYNMRRFVWLQRARGAPT